MPTQLDNRVPFAIVFLGFMMFFIVHKLLNGGGGEDSPVIAIASIAYAVGLLAAVARL